MPDLDLPKGSCCECKHNKCNREREGSLGRFVFAVGLFIGIVYFNHYILPGWLKGGDHAPA
jgi:hypothetical protein